MSNEMYGKIAAATATIVTDHVLAAVEAARALREIEEGLKSLPALDFWQRKEIAEAIAAAAPGEMTTAEARSAVEVARAALAEGGRRKAAAQILAAVVVIKTDHAPMGDDRFRINIEAAHLTM